MAIEPIAPDVTPETEQEWETRSQFRLDLLDRLDEALVAAEHTVEGGPEDGVTVVTHNAWVEILRAAEFAPLPAIDRHHAEVVTGASVTVWATCPRCGIPGVINLQIDPELRVDTSSAELRLKAKAKPRTHVCGQLPLAVGSAEAEFQLTVTDFTGPVDPCPHPGCELAAEHEGDHHVVVIGTDLDEQVFEEGAGPDLGEGSGDDHEDDGGDLLP